MDGSGDPFDDPRMRAGVAHLQTAAHELIAAARAVLDVADDLVSDPASAAAFLAAVAGRVRPGAPRAPRPPGHPDEGDDDDGGSTVQRIPVS